jgi:Kef-type K+ transport system membrane component KefB
MVPRGEVGLIFAATGQTLGVVTPEIFSIIVIMVLLSTLLTPLVLTFILKRAERGEKVVVVSEPA